MCDYKTRGILAVMALSTGIGIGLSLENKHKCSIDINKKVMSSGLELITPTRLEIITKGGFEGDNEPETVINIDGSSYLLRFNDKEEPMLLKYKQVFDSQTGKYRLEIEH